MDADMFALLVGPPGPAAIAEAIGLLDAGVEPLAATARLRLTYPELAASGTSAAVTQATLRRRGRTKFGADADVTWFTADGLEQATSAVVASHRARRFGALAASLGRPPLVADLCCGIGSDLRALAAAGSQVTGFDFDPATAAMARLNAAVVVECIDADLVDVGPFDAVFIDPARRAGGRRTFDVNAYSPPWSFVTSTLANVSGAAKLAPGIPHELVPADLEAEWVSLAGGLKEAVLWSGAFTADGVRRRATLLPSGATMTSKTDVDGPAPVATMRRYLYEPDDAVVRAHLIGDLARELDGVLLDPTTAYLTSDELVATPFAQVFEVDEVLPFSLKRLRAALRDRGVGAATVMKRGSAVDVEQLRRDLRLSGDRSAVVVLALIAGRHHAVIAKPVRL